MKNRYIEISKSRLSQFEENIPWQKINQVIEFGSSYGDTLEDIGIKNKIKNLIGFDLQEPKSSKVTFYREDLNQINLKNVVQMINVPQKIYLMLIIIYHKNQMMIGLKYNQNQYQ